MALGEGDVLGESAATPEAAARHLTRGFLFADLRGYTAYVEAHGDTAGAALLDTYRRLVRDVVRRAGGAEIKTEGDSFYVVFPSASAAVRCGLALVAAAASATAEYPERPIAVGVGVHAGETVETAEGYVGSAVNLAARLCAIAGPGEVLVSDTVRGLTRTSVEATFTSRGRKQLKGIAEPIAVYAATPASAGAGVAPPPRPPLGTRLLGFGDPRRVAVAVGGTAAAVVLAALLVAGAFGGGFGPNPSPHTPRASASRLASGSEAPASPSSGASTVATIPEDVIGTNFTLTPATYAAPQLPGSPRLTITDDGWSAEESFSGKLVLGRTTSPGNRVTLQWLTELTSDVCAVQPSVKIGPDPEAQFLAWARAAKSLQLSPAVLRRFGDLSATELDISIVEQNACLYADPRSVSVGPCKIGAGADSCLALVAGPRIRLEVSSRDGRLILVIIEAPSATDFDAFEPLAERILSTLTFPS